MIETIVHELFNRLNGIPKETLIEQRYTNQIAEYQLELTSAKATLGAYESEALAYESEVIKVIRGESKLNADMLNKLYVEAREKVTLSEQTVKELEKKLQNSEQMKKMLSKQFDNMKTWSDMYDECDLSTKKMIVSQMMNAIRVKRGYEIEVDLTGGVEQFCEVADSVAGTKSGKNTDGQRCKIPPQKDDVSGSERKGKSRQSA